MQTYSLNRPIEKWCLGSRKEGFDPEANRPQWNTATTETHCGCTERKSTLLRVSCGRVEGTKKEN